MSRSRSVLSLRKLLMKKNTQSLFCRGSRVGCNSLQFAGDTPAATVIVAQPSWLWGRRASCLSIYTGRKDARQPHKLAIGRFRLAGGLDVRGTLSTLSFLLF